MKTETENSFVFFSDFSLFQRVVFFPSFLAWAGKTGKVEPLPFASWLIAAINLITLIK